MSEPRIEELSDSDPPEGDISDLSDEDFDDRDILRARLPKAADKILKKSAVNAQFTRFQTTEDTSAQANFQCIYPIYFDITRSRREGRMVGKDLAVENPLAQEIANACGSLRLETLFEPTKCHPRDWANPGRIKVNLRGGRNPSIKNKHHLYILISKHLKANPTTTTTARAMLVPGIPPPDNSKDYPTPAIPHGWKIGRILPYYSPALTDGGASEDMFKQVMSQMQATGGGMPDGIAGGLPNMSALQGILGGVESSNSGVSGSQEKLKKKSKKKV